MNFFFKFSDILSISKSFTSFLFIDFFNSFLLIFICLLLIYLGRETQGGWSLHTETRGQLSGVGSHLPPFQHVILGIELKSQGLAASKSLHLLSDLRAVLLNFFSFIEASLVLGLLIGM